MNEYDYAQSAGISVWDEWCPQCDRSVALSTAVLSAVCECGNEVTAEEDELCSKSST